MTSPNIIGRQLRFIGKAVLSVAGSKKSGSPRARGFMGSYFLALAGSVSIPVAAAGALYLAMPEAPADDDSLRTVAYRTVRVPDLSLQMASIESANELRTYEHHTGPSETLASLFVGLSVNDKEAFDFITSRPEAAELLSPKAGNLVTASVQDGGKLESLSLYLDGTNPGDSKVLRLARTGNGFDLKTVPYEYEVQTVMVHGVVASGSADASLRDRKVPASVVSQMHEAFDYDNDEVSRLADGDKFRIIYEAKYADGRFARYGKLLAMQLESSEKTVELFWFNNGRGGNYYDFEGKLHKRTFMRVPLDIKSVSSEFSPMRKHPVTGVLRPHQGTDFRAPWGAVVRAASDGKVIFAGVGNGYGNYIRLQHGPDIVTVYAHLSSISSHVKRGIEVKRGEIIGKVGQTGLATGPHLHYELKFDGVQVNPMTVILPDESELSPYQYARMQVQAAPLRDKLNLLRQVQVAEAN